ncbi:hypothetical protein AAG570_006125 [Ranatra chinensis]|uniref:Malate dehydrogenase, mitochondrial n=1 Tax=Ranatra chinensis TaxID=642074 RepID=A0ABD0YKS2_9HEMI
MKREPLVSRLSLYDLAHTAGVAADLGHIDTPSGVSGHAGKESLQEALRDMDVVLIPAGLPRKPGMSRDDLFNSNASVPRADLPQDCVRALTARIQDAGTEVVKAKAGAGSATLSMAHAAARFALSLCRGLCSHKGVVECAYVASDVTQAKYFATPLILGPEGVECNLGTGHLSQYECALVQAAIPQLQDNIQKGEQFVNAQC